jgi:hypothetical protein
MKERRKTHDRRIYHAIREKFSGNNLRRFPDRRLNNIVVEWIPMGLAHAHPVSRNVFQLTKRLFNTT